MAANPEETLAAEARRRTKAGATAIAAAVLSLAGSLVVLASSDDFPTVRLLDALRQSFGPEPASGAGLVARQVHYLDDHLAQVLAVQVIPAVATALIGLTLVFLYLSTKARNPELNKIALIASIAGAGLVAIPAIVGAVALTVEIGAFASSATQTEQAAREALRSSTVGAAFSLVQLGTFVVGLGFVLSSLNAMRVGLLTRFMGVLGIIVGLLFLFPLEGQLPFVKIFWLLGIGALFFGRWPGGMPPAWVTGEAQPWPTQQQLREQRSAHQAERGAQGLDDDKEGAKPRWGRRERAEPPETPAPELPPPGKLHTSSKKKKRKRR